MTFAEQVKQTLLNDISDTAKILEPFRNILRKIFPEIVRSLFKHCCDSVVQPIRKKTNFGHLLK